MTRVLRFAVAVVFTAGFIACGDDPDPSFGAPEFTAEAANSTVEVGGMTTITIDVSSAEGTIASIEATTSSGTIDAPTTLNGQTSGSVQATFTAANSRSVADIQITVTDSQNPVKASTQELSIRATSFDTDGNSVEDPGFGATDIVPAANTGSPFTVSGNSFIETADYVGAVDPNAATPWYIQDTWSFYAHILVNQGVDKSRNQGVITVTVTDGDLDGDGNADGDVIDWSALNTYVLDGFVFVNDGQTLNIEAGTVIKGKSGTGEDASALIVARGGTINANGTSTAPIIFTAEADPLDGTSSPSTRGLWGGLIILGNASLNSAPGETQIEGIPTSETRGLYGGSIDDDNSGRLSYVSIRHGGSEIGAGNEINGLTLGGVGSGTTIDYVEVVGNADDGIEWFGGTVNAKHLIVVFQGDDGLDYDEGYRGSNQFVIVHQDPATGAGDRGGEHDGGTSPETGTPFATPTFVNVTSVGKATDNNRALTFRDNAGGSYYNSIFVDYGRGIDVEDILADEQDSWKQYVDGDLGIYGCVFNNIAVGSTSEALFTVSEID